MVQVLEQLKLEPEAAMLTDVLLKQAAAVHTIVPAGHHIGTPQVQTLLSSTLATPPLSRTQITCSPTGHCQRECKTRVESLIKNSSAIVQVLFQTIPKELEDALRLRYAGTQAERSSAAKGKKAADKGTQCLLLVSPARLTHACVCYWWHM